MTIRHIYAGLTAVFVASAVTVALVPASEFVKGMFAIPGVGALCGALLQLARDYAAFDRSKFLQLDQQIFSLGASSHMSATAFDKHVAFCEAYMIQVHDAVTTLFREGPTEKAADCANKLFAIKREFAAWIPKSMALKLEPFEDALYKIGVDTHLVNALRTSADPTRKEALDRSYALFKDVLQLEPLKGEDPNYRKDVAVENVKEQIRSILGIEELVEVRSFIIARAAKFARERT